MPVAIYLLYTCTNPLCDHCTQYGDGHKRFLEKTNNHAQADAAILSYKKQYNNVSFSKEETGAALEEPEQF